MKAVQFNAYGGPEVVHLVEIATPHAGPGQVSAQGRVTGKLVISVT